MITSPSRISELDLAFLTRECDDVAVFDQPLDLRAGVVGDLAGEEPIEAIAFMVGLGGEFEAVSSSAGSCRLGMSTRFQRRVSFRRAHANRGFGTARPRSGARRLGGSDTTA